MASSRDETKPDKQAKNRGKNTRFKPGQSGNPKGRPRKDVCLTTLLKDEIEKVCPFNKENKTWMQLLVEATMRLAIKGNSTALREVWERIDGKVKEHVEVESRVRVIELPAVDQDSEIWAAECREEYERIARDHQNVAAAGRATKLAAQESGS